MPSDAVRILTLVLVCASAPALAQKETPPGLVGEPTETEIETAYAARLSGINTRSREILGDPDAALMTLTLEDLKKLSCRGLDRVGVHYDCRVEMRMRQAERRPGTRVLDLWLSHENGVWVAR
ncbi:MAG: hypothetical protein WBG92_24395 [Thiohalocapsa sp.]